MKKIIFLTGSQSLKGGTERACANVANLLAEKEGYDVKIVSLFGDEVTHYPISSKVAVSSIFRKSKSLGVMKNLLLFFMIPLTILREKPDFVIAVESIIFLYFIGMFLAPFKKTRFLCWEHFNATTDLGVIRRRWARWLAAKCASKIIVLSEEDKKYWQDLYPESYEKTSVVYNVNPVKDFPLGKNIHVAEVERDKIVLAAGRMTEQKGFDLLIRAWAKININAKVGWKLKIVGSGPLLQQYRGLVESLGIASEVVTPGQIDDIESEYKRAKIFVLSSRFEGFGLVLVEALSYGLPCISFDCPAGPQEIVKHDTNGFLVPCGDVEKLSVALQYLMSDEAELERLKNNTPIGLEKFSPLYISKRWGEVFDTMVAKIP